MEQVTEVFTERFTSPGNDILCTFPAGIHIQVDIRSSITKANFEVTIMLIAIVLNFQAVEIFINKTAMIRGLFSVLLPYNFTDEFSA